MLLHHWTLDSQNQRSVIFERIWYPPWHVNDMVMLALWRSVYVFPIFLDMKYCVHPRIWTHAYSKILPVKEAGLVVCPLVSFPWLIVRLAAFISAHRVIWMDNAQVDPLPGARRGRGAYSRRPLDIQPAYVLFKFRKAILLFQKRPAQIVVVLFMRVIIANYSVQEGNF